MLRYWYYGRDIKTPLLTERELEGKMILLKRAYQRMGLLMSRDVFFSCKRLDRLVEVFMMGIIEFLD